MEDVIVFFVIFCLAFIPFLLFLRGFFIQWRLRKALKRGLKENRQHIGNVKGYKSGEFEIYKRVYNDALYRTKYLKLFKSPIKLQKQLNNELNRMVQNPFSKFFSWCLIRVKGLCSLVLLLASLLFGSMAMDEWKAADLQLPTLDPNMTIAMKQTADVSLDGLLQFFKDSPAKLQSFNYEALSQQADPVDPVYANYDMPENIASPEELGQAIVAQLTNFEPQFNLTVDTSSMPMVQMQERAFEWMEQEEPYISRMRQKISYKYYDYGTVNDVQYTVSYDLAPEKHALMLGKVKQIVANMPTGLADVEKVKYVNDYLVSQTVYNLNSADNPYTPYSILINGEGVCQGYALAAYLLLKEMDFEVRFVTGDAIPVGGHAWNLVKVDGEWYHLDTTWNDPIPDQGKNIRYDYFLLADATISQDHVWDTSLYPATSTTDYY